MRTEPDFRSVRIAGAVGLAGCCVALAEFPLWFVGDAIPPFWEAEAFAQFVAKNATLSLTRTVMDLVIFGLLLVFFGGLRHVIVLTQPPFEWLATTAFGTAIASVTVMLVSDALAATVALNTLDGHADATVIRALNESTILLFGSVGAFLAATILTLNGVLVLLTRALPRWTGWLGLASAAVNLAFVPTLYFGNDFRRYYTASGDGPAATAPLAFVLWLVTTAVCMTRRR